MMCKPIQILPKFFDVPKDQYPVLKRVHVMHPAHRFAPHMAKEDVNRFLSKLRHDMRNTIRPLVEVPKWISEDLKDTGLKLDDAMVENFRMLDSYGNRLSQMVEDLITYVHIGQEENPSTKCPSQVFTELTNGTIPPGFEIKGTFEHDDLPLSERDLNNLMDALMSNAIKHHDRDTGRVQVACRATELVVQLSVFDDGPGIPEDFHGKVFDPLTTLRSRDEVEGSGMGLTIVHHIARMNDGGVKLISPGTSRGTCVTVWFEKQDS